MTEPFAATMFSTITTMVTAAPLMLDEPINMATFRIMDAASKLAAQLEDNGVIDSFLSDFRNEWENNKATMMSDPDKYITLLDDIATRFVREVKQRNKV